MTRNCVTYFRVSTDKQGKSGLGIDAQREAVSKFMERNGWNLVGAFEEHETGKGRDALENRPQLKEALRLAKQKKAVLVIAKLDRLARNVAFISNLMEAGVDFVACDLPDANRLTVHILAAVAEDEARRISERTSDALQQLREKLKDPEFQKERLAKGKSIQLGNPQTSETLNGPRIAKANQFAESMRSYMEDFRRRGLSQEKMMKELNARNIKSAQGNLWSVGSVQNCLKRLGLNK